MLTATSVAVGGVTVMVIILCNSTITVLLRMLYIFLARTKDVSSASTANVLVLV